MLLYRFTAKLLILLKLTFLSFAAYSITCFYLAYYPLDCTYIVKKYLTSTPLTKALLSYDLQRGLHLRVLDASIAKNNLSNASLNLQKRKITAYNTTLIIPKKRLGEISKALIENSLVKIVSSNKTRQEDKQPIGGKLLGSNPRLIQEVWLHNFFYLEEGCQFDYQQGHYNFTHSVTEGATIVIDKATYKELSYVLPLMQQIYKPTKFKELKTQLANVIELLRLIQTYASYLLYEEVKLETNHTKITLSSLNAHLAQQLSAVGIDDHIGKDTHENTYNKTHNAEHGINNASNHNTLTQIKLIELQAKKGNLFTQMQVESESGKILYLNTNAVSDFRYKNLHLNNILALKQEAGLLSADIIKGSIARESIIKVDATEEASKSLLQGLMLTGRLQEQSNGQYCLKFATLNWQDLEVENGELILTAKEISEPLQPNTELHFLNGIAKGNARALLATQLIEHVPSIRFGATELSNSKEHTFEAFDLEYEIKPQLLHLKAAEAKLEHEIFSIPITQLSATYALKATENSAANLLRWQGYLLNNCTFGKQAYDLQGNLQATEIWLKLQLPSQFRGKDLLQRMPLDIFISHTGKASIKMLVNGRVSEIDVNCMQCNQQGLLLQNGLSKDLRIANLSLYYYNPQHFELTFKFTDDNNAATFTLTPQGLVITGHKFTTSSLSKYKHLKLKVAQLIFKPNKNINKSVVSKERSLVFDKVTYNSNLQKFRGQNDNELYLTGHKRRLEVPDITKIQMIFPNRALMPPSYGAGGGAPGALSVTNQRSIIEVEKAGGIYQQGGIKINFMRDAAGTLKVGQINLTNALIQPIKSLLERLDPNGSYIINRGQGDVEFLGKDIKITQLNLEHNRYFIHLSGFIEDYMHTSKMTLIGWVIDVRDLMRIKNLERSINKIGFKLRYSDKVIIDLLPYQTIPAREALRNLPMQNSVSDAKEASLEANHKQQLSSSSINSREIGQENVEIIEGSIHDEQPDDKHPHDDAKYSKAKHGKVIQKDLIHNDPPTDI